MVFIWYNLSLGRLSKTSLLQLHCSSCTANEKSFGVGFQVATCEPWKNVNECVLKTISWHGNVACTFQRTYIWINVQNICVWENHTHKKVNCNKLNRIVIVIELRFRHKTFCRVNKLLLSRIFYKYEFARCLCTWTGSQYWGQTYQDLRATSQWGIRRSAEMTHGSSSVCVCVFHLPWC